MVAEGLALGDDVELPAARSLWRLALLCGSGVFVIDPGAESKF